MELFFVHICKKKKSSVFNLTRNLKLKTFDHGTFLHKVNELLLITLHYTTLQITDRYVFVRCF